MRETWYVMEDGSPGDPRGVAPDEHGVLRDAGGQAVAMKGEVPHTRGVDLDDGGEIAPPPAVQRTDVVTAKPDAVVNNREMKTPARRPSRAKRG